MWLADLIDAVKANCKFTDVVANADSHNRHDIEIYFRCSVTKMSPDES
jgi:hypothetical protein